MGVRSQYQYLLLPESDPYSIFRIFRTTRSTEACKQHAISDSNTQSVRFYMLNVSLDRYYILTGTNRLLTNRANRLNGRIIAMIQARLLSNHFQNLQFAILIEN